jgi:hypothetical protein
MSKTSDPGVSSKAEQLSLSQVLDCYEELALTDRLHVLSPEEHRAQLDELIASTNDLQKKIRAQRQKHPHF